MRILIKNGLVISPDDEVYSICDVYVKNGVVAEIGQDIKRETDTVIDATDLVVSPGLIDMHVHLRDPGFTHKEDIISGCAAAAAGGITAVAAMPNTNPITDSAEILEYIHQLARTAAAKVYPVASISKGLKGDMLNDYGKMKKAGAVAVSDDGLPVENADMMKTVLENAHKSDMLVISHCEDLDIIKDGIMNEGEISKELEVSGMHRSSEDYITAREIILAETTNTRIHIAHVSTKGSVALIREAKARGVNVTCETCPHYFSMTDHELSKLDADYRMNPPLREEEDRQAIIAGILDGTIDCIVTDHAPHTPEEKADFLTAPNGVIGLETSLSATLTELYHKGICTLDKIIKLMAVNPAKVLGVSGGTLRIGSAADITIFDPAYEWTVDPAKMKSKSRNSAFKGRTLKGKAVYTICNGKMVYNEMDINDK